MSVVEILQWYGAVVVVCFVGEMLNSDHGLLPTIAFALAAPVALPLLLVACIAMALWELVQWFCGVDAKW